MRQVLNLGILGSLILACGARGDEPPKAQQAAARPDAKAAEAANLLTAVREALERNAQEIKDLKEQYARDMAEQRKKIEEQQKKIEMLEQSA